jgi:hypothetical protein
MNTDLQHGVAKIREPHSDEIRLNVTAGGRVASVFICVHLWFLLSLWEVALAQPASGAESFTDPFAYCAAVKTIDAPDARYQGPTVPESIARGLQKATGAPAGDFAPFSNSYWRCMDGKLYACTVGANLPCTAKADASRTPGPELATYCKEQPEADVIPAYVTGRETVYAWRCRGGAPVIERQVAQADARGFIAGIWYEIPPP